MKKMVWILLVVAGLFYNQLLVAENKPENQPEAAENQIIVYYFHNTFRCVSCNTIEGLTKVAVYGGEFKNPKTGQTVKVKPEYQDLIDKKALVFKAVNVDKQENKHFLDDFKAEAKYPVLVEIKDGKVIKYKVLEDVWELMGNNDKFVEYIHSNLNEYIKSF